MGKIKLDDADGPALGITLAGVNDPGASRTHLQKTIESHLDAIAGDIGARPVGSAENAATYDYINGVIAAAGMDAYTFESAVEYRVATNWSCTDRWGTVSMLPGASSPPLDVVDAVVMPTVYRTAEDLKEQPPEAGSIAVASLGILHESQFCELVEPAAAVAWFREGHLGLYSGNCKRPDTQPLVAGFAIDEATAAKWTSEPTRINAQITVTNKTVVLRSIICDFAIDGGLAPCFVAHYDSKPLAPGANDNASGVAALLAMLERWPSNKPARFIFFDGEEIGLLGSSAYVDDLERSGRLSEVGCVVCPDSVGLGELHLYTADKYGPFPELTLQRCRAEFRSRGWSLPERVARFGGSDYVSFHVRGIPSIFLSDFPNTVRHTTMDTLDRVDTAVLAYLAEVLTEARWQE
jgi:hypothetical protein